MRHTPQAYRDIGAEYSKASPDRAQALAQQIRRMLDSEKPVDRVAAREELNAARADLVEREKVLTAFGLHASAEVIRGRLERMK